jgi:hypothetical protein
MMTDITGMTHKIVKIFAISLALIFVVVFLTASMPQSTTQTNPQVIAQEVANPFQGQPIVSENTNITWSSFNQSMAPNEYLNATAHPEYINAEPSLYYPNYISINPSDIIAPKALQNDPLGNLNTAWDAALIGTSGGALTNSTASVSWSNVSGMGEETVTVDVTGTHPSEYKGVAYRVDVTNYSSESLEYDYVTFIYTLSIPSNTGVIGVLQLHNSSGSYATTAVLNNSGSYYISESLAQIQKGSNYAVTWNTTAGKGYSPYLVIYPQLIIPSGAPTGTYSLTVNGVALTTYPITFGNNANGTTLTQSQGSLRLAEFHPDNINNVTVVGDGYSEALSMPTQMSQNYTQTQNQLTGSNYIEETTSQGDLLYPTGTDISYSGSNVSVQFNGVSGSQIPLLNVNGVSYSTQISNVSGNSTTLIATNPNQPVNVIYQVEYTATQWNSFTAPPFFLSVQGIEYYWWIGLIAIFGGLGIFAGLRSYATGKEENLRAPPKVR